MIHNFQTLMTILFLQVRLRWYEVRENDVMRRELLRETLQPPQLQLVPHVGYVSMFPFMMGAIPPVCSLPTYTCSHFYQSSDAHPLKY